MEDKMLVRGRTQKEDRKKAIGKKKKNEERYREKRSKNVRD
jgi:hypothetical protein